jgi:acetylornithine deacetylase/succinyl-diaminopimelate desuccinylase-like protein
MRRATTNSELLSGQHDPAIDLKQLCFSPVDGGAHSAEEYIDIDKIAPRIYLLARLIVEISEGK